MEGPVLQTPYGKSWWEKEKLICQSSVGYFWPEEMGRTLGRDLGRECSRDIGEERGWFSLPDSPGEKPGECGGAPRTAENPFPRRTSQ